MKTRRFALCTLTAALLAAFGQPAYAIVVLPVDTYWIGGNGSWSEGVHWTNRVPDIGDNAFLLLPTEGGRVDLDVPSVLNQLVIGSDHTLSQSFHALSSNVQYLGAFCPADVCYLGPGSGIGVHEHFSGTNTVADNLELGHWAGTNGHYLLVSGTVQANDLHIGEYGHGSFIQNGGSVTIASELFMGRNASATGAYELNNGDLSVVWAERVGVEGTATFQHGNGTNSTGVFILGDHATGSGTYQLGGFGSLNVSVESFVGRAGTGTFLHFAGVHNTGNLVLGVEASGEGTYNLSPLSYLPPPELQARWLTVGNEGSGSFDQFGGNVTVGGAAPDVGTLTLGRFAGSTGEYRLMDGQLTMLGNEIYIGEHGRGTFWQLGGTHTFNAAMYLGVQSTGIGEYQMQDGLLTSDPDGEIILGEWGGTGIFSQQGGAVSVDILTLARQKVPVTSQGFYTLDDGSLTTFEQRVGHRGIGVFTQYGGVNNAGNLILGVEASGEGTYKLYGGTLNDTLIVGDWGRGTFENAGGMHNVAGDLILGNQVTGSGTYKLLSTGELNVSGSSFIAQAGTGSFLHMGGTHWVGDNLQVGYGAGSSGTYQLDAGAIQANDLHIGEYGSGTFIQNGGSITIASELFMGRNAAADGTYQLNGGNLRVDGIEWVGADGTATFNQNGGTNTARGLHIGSAGSYTIRGGTLSVDEEIINYGQFSALGGSVYADSVQNHGILNSIGIIHADLGNLEGGTLSPGASPGTLVIGGDYVQDALSTLLMELAGYTQGSEYDFLHVLGDAMLAGLLKVDLLSGFDPVIGSLFHLVHADGELSGQFTSLDLPSLSGRYWDIVYDYDTDDVWLRVLERAPSGVPEPATLALLGLGLLGLGVMRRRH